MKKTTYKRLVYGLLAFLMCLGSISCAKEPASDATTEEITLTATETKEKPIPVPSTIVDEPVDEIPEDELLGKIGAWRGWGDSGTLTNTDNGVIPIKSKADLDPYRPYLSNFTAADEKKILADTEGACVIVELVDLSKHHYFGTASVIQSGSVITIVISADEVEDELPTHTFFLLYFPEKYYNGEVIEIAF